MRSRLLTTCLTLWLVALVLMSASVSAQSNETQEQQVALNRFEPAFAGDRMYGVPSPYTPGHPGINVALLLDYAHKPLVLRREGDDEELGAIVSSQFFMHLNASVAFWNRVNVNVNAPVALYQAGDDPSGGGLAFSSPDSAQFGDLRLGARVRLYGDYWDPIQLALGGYLWFPTGPSDSFVSEKSVRGMPQIIAGGMVQDRIMWSFSVGSEFRPDVELASTAQGSMLRWGAGLGMLLDSAQRVQVSGELTGGFVYDQVDAQTLNSELLFGLRYRVLEYIEAGAGIGPGLSSGAGTPDFRAVAMLAYSPRPRRAVAEPRDRDQDGIIDDVDACPDVPGVASQDPKLHGCPPPSDRDGDQIVDEADACPDEPGIPDEDPAKNGCPPPSDRDGDGIVDEVDACPDVPGVAQEEPTKNGCPPDRDDDQIPDDKDACPDIKGVPSDDPEQHGCPPDSDGDSFRDDQDGCPFEKGSDDPDPAKRGCPKMVRVTDNEIVILQQVLFATGRAVIKKESFPLIDEVAGVLNDHPEILKLRVEGHTDSRGSKAFNMRLSQQRADSVMKALVERGISAEVLSAKGFGPTEPIGDNKTEEGRQQNRRVQFTILEKKPKPGQVAKPGAGEAKPGTAPAAPEAPAKP